MNFTIQISNVFLVTLIIIIVSCTFVRKAANHTKLLLHYGLAEQYPVSTHNMTSFPSESFCGYVRGHDSILVIVIVVMIVMRLTFLRKIELNWKIYDNDSYLKIKSLTHNERIDFHRLGNHDKTSSRGRVYSIKQLYLLLR